MNSITELAKLFKKCENKEPYSPIIGTVIDVKNIKIRVNDRVILTKKHLVLCFKISCETDADGNYINLGKKVILLPFSHDQKFILIGMVQNE